MEYGVVEAAGDGIIGGGITQEQEGLRQGVTFYGQVDDLEWYLGKIQGMGGKTVALSRTFRAW